MCLDFVGVCAAKQRAIIAYAQCHVTHIIYLKVTIICRYIFLRIQFKASFVRTNICNLYVEMVQGLHFLMFGTTCS